MGRPQKTGKVAIIGGIADVGMTRQMIADSTKGQAIAARAMILRMATRAIRDRRIAGRRGSPQRIVVGMMNDAIAGQRGSPPMIIKLKI